MSALIVVMIIVAFVCARMMRSTKLWWACVIAILAGLLIGVTSKQIVSDSNDELTVITTDFSSSQDIHTQCVFDDMLAASIEDNNIVGYVYSEESGRLTGYNSHPIGGIREPPAIIDDS